jgi:hypothetical protein
MEVSNLDGLTPQNYTINIKADATTVSQDIDVELNLTTANFDLLALTSPIDGAVDVGLAEELKWEADANAVSYDVQVASDNNFTLLVFDENVTTNSSIVNGVLGNTIYYWRVKAKNNCGEGSYSSNFSFTTLTPSYCTSTFTDEAGGSEHITNVTFNTINNTSDNDTTDGYEDFTSISTILERGESHQISVTLDTGGYQDHCYVFIDWNQDYIFDEATERYALGTVLSDVGTKFFTITVPETAVLGATTMRVIIEYDDPDDGFGSGSCNSDHLTEWGETEDYTIIVDNTAAINDIAFEGFNLFPNPTEGEFTLNFKVINTDEVSVELFDIRGRMIDEKKYYNLMTDFSKKMIFTKASAGLYLLKVSNGNKQTTRKLMIK